MNKYNIFDNVRFRVFNPKKELGITSISNGIYSSGVCNIKNDITDGVVVEVIGSFSYYFNSEENQLENSVEVKYRILNMNDLVCENDIIEKI